MALSQARLKQLLDYDPTRGIFSWRIDRSGPMKAGMRAGTINKRGHRQICIDQVIYLAGPLSFLWMTGKWPKRLVDHANGKANDDRWLNLREADHSQNGGNSSRWKNKKLPKGVTLKRPGQYFARIKINYDSIYLGAFDNPHDAHAAYMKAARQHFGDFARAE